MPLAAIGLAPAAVGARGCAQGTVVVCLAYVNIGQHLMLRFQAKLQGIEDREEAKIGEALRQRQNVRKGSAHTPERRDKLLAVQRVRRVRQA